MTGRHCATTVILCALATAAGAQCIAPTANPAGSTSFGDSYGASPQSSVQFIQATAGSRTRVAAAREPAAPARAPRSTQPQETRTEPDGGDARSLLAALALMVGIGLRQLRR